MSRSTRTCSLRSAAAIALTSSFLITGFGASIAQADRGDVVPAATVLERLRRRE